MSHLKLQQLVLTDDIKAPSFQTKTRGFPADTGSDKNPKTAEVQKTEKKMTRKTASTGTKGGRATWPTGTEIREHMDPVVKRCDDESWFHVA